MIHRVLFAAAVAAFPLLLAVSAPSGPRAALDRHTAYVGHPDGLVTTYQFKPASSATPAPGATYEPEKETEYRRGLLYRQVSGAEGVDAQDGFTGRAFWRANENHQVVILLENDARRALTSTIVESGQFDANTEVQDRGSRTIDGKQVDVVRIKPKDGVPADLAIDPATGAYVEVTLDPEDGRFVEHVEGYTEIAPGVRVPSVIRYGKNTRYVLLHGEARAISDDELKAPSPTAKWTFGSGDPVPIEVARHTGGSSEVILNASINGHPGRFLLDSGAGGSIVYQPYAGKLGLSVLGNTAFGGVAGGTKRARFARATAIRVGDNTLSNVILTVAEPSTTVKEPLDGILGFELLANAVVHVNLADKTIAFADPAKVEAVVGKGAYAFPVNLAGNVPEIALKVGNVSTRAIFDTGDSFFATLSDNLKTSGRIVALPDEIQIGAFTIQTAFFFQGVDGVTPEPETCYRLHEITIGPYRYQNATTCFASQKVFGKDGGLIGFDFLRHFNWTFDYTRNHLVLTPNGL